MNDMLPTARFSRSAEAAYLADPDNLRHQVNYILFVHAME